MIPTHDMNNVAIAEQDFGATFVGSYMILCARVEEWAATILIAASSDKADGAPVKIPRMLGPKLKAIADLVARQPNPISKPQRVSQLMSRFAAPAKLRSNMAHSTLTPVKNGEETCYLFHTVDSGERFWMTKADIQNALVDLKKLVKEVTDHQMKKPTPPSSPPQPKQGAAAGP